MTTLDIGIGGIGLLRDDGDVMAAARRAEESGFESVWTADLVIGDGTPALDSTVVLAMAAAATERVGLGFGVLAVPTRPVAWLATQVATLQHLSGDRVVLGVGAGGMPDTPFWSALGVPGRERGRRTDAALSVLPNLVAGEPVRVEDAAEPTTLTLAPAASVPPILVGGTSPAALRRSVAYGDGWFASLVSPETLAAGTERLRELAAEAGRPRPSVTVGVHYVPGEERDGFARSLVDDHGLPAEDAARVSVSGGPAQVAEGAAAYAAAGADRIVFAPTGGDWMDQCAVIGAAGAQLGEWRVRDRGA